MNPLHSKRDPNWCTPPDLLDRIRTCLGGIDLDPFSSATANKTVQAKRYFTPEQDGFAQPWNADTICINPPGTTGSPSHGNFICGLNIPHERFLEYFGCLGRVTKGILAI